MYVYKRIYDICIHDSIHISWDTYTDILRYIQMSWDTERRHELIIPLSSLFSLPRVTNARSRHELIDIYINVSQRHELIRTVGAVWATQVLSIMTTIFKTEAPNPYLLFFSERQKIPLNGVITLQSSPCRMGNTGLCF